MKRHSIRSGALYLATAGLLLTATARADAADIAWWSDLQAAAQESRRSKKPMLLEFTASWCTYCKKMEQSFADERVARQLQACFIPVTIDADVQVELAEAVGVEGLPATVIISPELKILAKITGFNTPAQLNEELGKICPADGELRQPRLANAAPRRPAKPAPRIGFHRYCLVSLLDRRKLHQGSGDYTVSYKGSTVCFVSQEFKQRFAANPEKYWPVSGGHCVVTAFDKDEQRPGEPRSAAVYRGRLWFFADVEMRKKFAKAPRLYATPPNEE